MGVCVCVLRKKLVMKMARGEKQRAPFKAEMTESRGGCPCGLGLDE